MDFHVSSFSALVFGRRADAGRPAEGEESVVAVGREVVEGRGHVRHVQQALVKGVVLVEQGGRAEGVAQGVGDS